jgi:hypothetical protein
MATQPSSPAKPVPTQVAPVASQPAAAPTAPQTPVQTPPNPGVAASPAGQKPPQPQVPAAGVKPAKKVNKFFLKPDWLFILACLIALSHVMLLVFVENEKNEFNALKEEDADRVYILQKASSVTQADVNTLEQAFLDEKSVVSFIQTLETSRPMFDEFTLAFTSDDPQGKDPHYLPFTITASGGRATLISFLEKLLSSTYVIEASTITINEDLEDSTKATLDFTGNLYIKNGK